MFKPDKSKWKRDIDLVRENHRFLWEDDEGEEIEKKDLEWEQRIAKKYWDKLFKEYAICDLTFYKSKFLDGFKTGIILFLFRKPNSIPLAN